MEPYIKIQINVLNSLFELYNKEKINYCILRNYEDLPVKIGNDLDILIEKNQSKEVLKLLNKILKQYNFKLLKKNIRFGYIGVYYCHIETGNVILFDFYLSFSKRWYQYADVDYILDNKMKYKNFYIPQQGAILFTVLLKDLLTYSRLREKNNKLIENFTENLKQEFINTGKKYFTESLLENLYSKLEKGEVLPSKNSLLKLLKNSNSRINFFRYTYYRVKEVIKNLLFNKLYFIAIIGPDGVGKSTVTSNLKKDLIDKNLFKNILDVHHRFEFIPNISVLMNRRLDNAREKEQESNATNPSCMHSWYRTLAYHMYYSVDYILGYIYILKYKARGDLIIADRYFYDFFIQKHYDALHRWVKKVFYILIPQPNIIFFLSADAEIIYKRKLELTLDETLDQNKRCENIVDENIGYIIDADKDAAQVNQQIKKIIFKTMASSD